MTEAHRARILVVEDEKSMREVLGILLEGEGYETVMAADGAEGMDWLDRDIFDLVITDIKMPGASGFEVLARAQSVAPETVVIMITAFGTVESGIEAMKLGAYDYINKPFKIDEIRLIVRNALGTRRLKTEVSALREVVRTSFEIENIVGRSPKMHHLLDTLPRIARSSSNVLITGESGTGKELVASALHTLSPRAGHAFVAINCANLPEGLLETEIFGHMRGSFTGATQNKQGLMEVADGGTFFLDEIGEMPMSLQSKLLRAIEYGSFRRVGGTTDITVNTRIISATNRDLKAEVAAGRFREDLFYRLNVIPVHIPPLRERREDIAVLVEHFARQFSDRPRQFSGSAMRKFLEHPWKGNVRELENSVERVLLLADTDIITDADIPEDVFRLEPTAPRPGGVADLSMGPVDLDSVLSDLERAYLKAALDQTGGNKTEAAKLLGLTFRSFRHKVSKFGIKH